MTLITFSLSEKKHSDLIKYINQETKKHNDNRSEALRAIIQKAKGSDIEEKIIGEIRKSAEDVKRQIEISIPNLIKIGVDYGSEEIHEKNKPSKEIESALSNLRQKGKKSNIDSNEEI